MIITYNEIKELSKNCYFDFGYKISTKHSVYNGEKDFALSLIEHCLCLLKRDSINDKFIIQYLQDLISLAQSDNSCYKNFLDLYLSVENTSTIIDNGEKLSYIDKEVINELMHSNLGEYLTKSEYESCCYSTMYAFFLTAYCILLKKIDFNIGHIDMIADLDDELESIQLFEKENEDEAIMLQWHSTNKINSIYMLYKYKYSGLDNSSILDLVAADVIEEDYYLKDERFSIAPSILVKQYCGIIEHEINELIQLMDFEDKPTQHLMWCRMTQYVKDKDIELSSSTEILYEILEELRPLRNKAAHGDVISKEEYQIMSRYKNLGLFNAISTEKLMLKNGKISPTIDEINEYMGF